MGQIDVKHAAGFLLAGAVTGAAIALLYAPQSGVQTKKDIKRFAQKTVKCVDDVQEDIRGQVAHWVEDLTEVVKDEVSRGRKLGEKGYEQVLQGFDNAKKCVEEGRSRLEQLIKTG